MDINIEIRTKDVAKVAGSVFIVHVRPLADTLVAVTLIREPVCNLAP